MTEQSLTLDSPVSAGALTYAEIFQQPELWMTTLERARAVSMPRQGPVVLTGAGTSAHAASAVAAGWPGALAIPTTDLLLETAPFTDTGLLISLARSGDSPESVGVVNQVHRSHPQVRLLAITCNPRGRLASLPGMELLLLDARTNDRSLAMTSSFSNLVLAGLCLHNADRLTRHLPAISRHVEAALPALESLARHIARRSVSRVLVLASSPLIPAAREAALKITEMSAGAIVALPETYLGLRHGPMTFLRPDALILCFQSSNPLRRRYENDLLREIKTKNLGRTVAIAEANSPDLFDDHVPANAPAVADELRTPFEIVFPQLLAYHLSLRCGLNPDSPSPDGVIARVVRGVTIYDEHSGF